MDSSSRQELYSELPPELRPPTLIERPDDYIAGFIRKYVPSNDCPNLETDLKKSRFPISTAKDIRKKIPKRNKKKKGLTRKEKCKLGLLRLPKDGWNHEQLQPMRNMWIQYIRELFNWNRTAPEVGTTEFANFVTLVNKAEYIGADIEIVRSKVPSLVGKSGTIIMETKNSLQIITPESQLKTILKDAVIFEIAIDTLKLTIFGKRMVNRPSERSIKKFKTNLIPDL